MGLHWTQLPAKWMGRGTSTGPVHRTITAANAAGIEDKRFARLDQSRHRIVTQKDVATMSDLAELQAFAIARWGACHSFLIQDEADYTTAPDGTSTPSLGEDSTPAIGTGNGTRVQWQLFKTYSTHTRHLRGIQPGSVVLSVNGVTQTEGTDFVVDYTMGTVTFLTAPTATHEILAGCKFYNVVRIDQDADGGLELVREDYDIGRASVSMTEDAVSQSNYGSASALGMSGMTDRTFAGGLRSWSSTGGEVYLQFVHGFAQEFSSLTSAVNLRLPDVDGGGSSGHPDIAPFSSGGVVPGGYFYIVNNDSTYAVTIQDWRGSSWASLDPISTVATGAVRTVFLDGAGIWRAR